MSAAPRWHEVATTGAAIALAGGFAEVAVQLFRRFALQGFTFMGGDLVWMTPLCALGLAAPIIVLLLVGRAIAPQRVGMGLVVGAPTALAALSLLFLLVHNSLHVAAQALLAVGIGRVAGLFAASHPDAARRLARRTALALGLALVALGAGRPGWLAWRERRALATLPRAAAGAPNILLIILDTVRSASLGLYGYARPTTPQLARWAARGVVFNRAYAPAPWTLPSHASLFTGYWPHELSADWETPLDRRQPTLAEVLARRGYATAGFVANQYFTSRESGMGRGFHHYEDYQRSRRQLRLSSGAGQLLEEWRAGYRPAHWMNARKDGALVSRQLLAWLDQPHPSPFFAFLNYYDAHLPYLASPALRQRFAAGQRRRDLYDASIAGLDEELDRLFAELERRGVLGRTIVIISSDHGEMIGERGLTEHGNSLYREELEIPLVMWGPGIPAGRRVAAPVSLRDLAATVTDLAGATDAEFPGRSLAAHWRGDSGAATSPALAWVTRPRIVEPDVPVAKGSMVAVVDGTLHYIRNGDGSEELYDLAADPREERNLAADGASGDTLARLRAAVRALGAGPR